LANTYVKGLFSAVANKGLVAIRTFVNEMRKLGKQKWNQVKIVMCGKEGI